MQQAKNVIIGLGKAGKSLATELGRRGESTVVIEKNLKNNGETSVNIACISSKKLAEMAKKKSENIDPLIYYKQAIQAKNELADQLHKSNYSDLQEAENIDIVAGTAYFLSEKEVLVQLPNGDETIYKAERIFINTGSEPTLPPVEGLEIDGQMMHTFETLMDDEKLPERLIILGDDFMGIEFASIYRQFGSNVQVLLENSREDFMKVVDNDISQTVLETLEATGIEVFFNTTARKVARFGNELLFTYEIEESTKEITADKLLIAAGRKPNVHQLNLEAANILLNENGSIRINKHLETTTKNIYALGDVKGGPQHTSLSLDDCRIVMSDLFEEGSYDLSERKNIPETLFTQPPLAMIGLSEELARGNGYNVKTALLPVKSLSTAKLFNQTAGLFKAVVDADTDLILGTFLFGEESHEIINIVTTALNAELPYTVLANQIFTHPTMAEAFNELYSSLD